MCRVPASLWIVLAGGLLAAAFLPAQEQKKPAAKPPHPVVDAHELMELFGEPIQEHLKSEVDKAGARDGKGWSTLGDRGLQVAEFANLIALREQTENRAKWIDQCAQLQQAGLQLAETAKAKNAEQIRPAYLAIIKSCNDCHSDFDPDHAPQIEP
jgi:hypothetical protein